MIREAAIESSENKISKEDQPLELASTTAIIRDYVVHHADLVTGRLVQPLSNYSTDTKAALNRCIGLLLSPCKILGINLFLIPLLHYTLTGLSKCQSIRSR